MADWLKELKARVQSENDSLDTARVEEETNKNNTKHVLVDMCRNLHQQFFEQTNFLNAELFGGKRFFDLHYHTGYHSDSNFTLVCGDWGCEISFDGAKNVVLLNMNRGTGGKIKVESFTVSSDGRSLYLDNQPASTSGIYQFIVEYLYTRSAQRSA